MPEFSVILLEPKFAGNIGFIARSMANFGVNKLILVNPCELGDDAFRFAKHARPIVEEASIVKDFTEAICLVDLVAGTSGILSDNQRKFNRHPVTPKEFAEHASTLDGNIGLVFGREDDGLHNHEIARCDILVNIPTSSEYPIMNVSHAATVLLYEIGTLGESSSSKQMAKANEKETLYKLFAEMLEETNYPKHKRPKTKVMFRRIITRARLSKWEFHTLAGTISRASRTIQRLKKQKGKK